MTRTWRARYGAYVCIVCTLLFLPAEALASQSGTASSETARREDLEAESDWQTIVRLLDSTRERGAPPVSELVEQIAPHVEKELPGVLAILFEGKAPPLAGEEPMRISQIQEALLEGALEKLPRSTLIAAVESFLAGREGEAVRHLRIQIEGCAGSAEQLPSIFELALREDETELLPKVAEKLRASLAKILARDAEPSNVWLLRRWRHLREPLLEPLVMALGDADDPYGVAVLTSIATWNDALADVAIAQVRSLGPSPLDEVNQELVELIRRRLDLTRPDRSQTLVLLMGELSDFESIPLLLDLLGGEHDGLAKSALWSLRRMTGLPLPSSVDLWRRWLHQELVWARKARPSVIERLASPLRADAVAAAKEIAHHRYDRLYLAARLAEALQSTDPEVRLAVCESLAALGTPLPNEALRRATEDRDLRVAAAAASALQAITAGNEAAATAQVQASEN